MPVGNRTQATNCRGWGLEKKMDDIFPTSSSPYIAPTPKTPPTIGTSRPHSTLTEEKIPNLNPSFFHPRPSPRHATRKTRLACLAAMRSNNPEVVDALTPVRSNLPSPLRPPGRAWGWMTEKDGEASCFSLADRRLALFLLFSSLSLAHAKPVGLFGNVL